MSIVDLALFVGVPLGTLTLVVSWRFSSKRRKLKRRRKPEF